MKAWLPALVAGMLGTFQASSAESVRDKLDAYLISYEPRLSELVAEEQMSQRVGVSLDTRDALAGRRPVATRAENRALVSEVAFVSLPGGIGWLGFRRVTSVNGKPIADAGTPLAHLLAGGQNEREQARLLLTQSATYNLGEPRTINLPNLPLELLHPRNRSRFAHRLDGREKIRGVETARVVFTEQSSPTIIRRPDGGHMNSRVTGWIETSTGRLIRAEVRTTDSRIGALPFSAVVFVDFKDEPKLGLLVPVEMREEFFAGRFNEGTGSAKYSNYRRFQTSGRIVPPPP